MSKAPALDPNNDIGEMMAAYAARAVELARERKVKLDFSEQSVECLEPLLSGAAPSDDLDELSKIWGAYLGEVVRRRFGGEWMIDRYPAGDFLIVTLMVRGSRLFPSMKVHRRLTEGDSENLWSFYQAVRKKLEAHPGAKIQ